MEGRRGQGLEEGGEIRVAKGERLVIP